MHVLIAANLVMLLLRSASMDGTAALVLSVQTHIFFCIVVAETCISLVGLGPKNFLSVPLNWLDLIVVSSSIAAYAVNRAEEADFLRALRCIRFLEFFALSAVITRKPQATHPA